jgi:siderophore synthetase component
MLHEPETAPPTRLSAAETRFLNGLRATRPDLVEPFISNLPRARRAATHRLLQSFLMEGFGVAERASWREGELILPLPGGRTLRYPCSRRYLSGRFDPAGGEALLAGAGGVERVEGPSRLLEVFAAEALLPKGADPTRFRSELENGVANHALSLVGARRRQRELAATARGMGAGSSLAVARALAGEVEGFSPLAFFEQLVSEGHPLHPCAKLKAGLGAAEAARYSPEWGIVLDLALAAVRGDACREVYSGTGSFRELLLEEHPEAGRAFEEGLRERGLEPAGYTPIPLHSWQLANTLPRLYAGARTRGEVVPVPEARIPARPLMSFRSFAPVGGGHHIKTAVDLRLTNAVRTVSPGSVENTAELTRVLREVRRREGFGERFAVLEERAGAYYDPPEGEVNEEERAVLAKNLAAILREDPESHLRPGELAMPAAALLAESPAGGPVLAEVVEEFAHTAGLRCIEEAAERFFRRYCEVSLPDFLTLMSRYGIGLEGHLQNCLPVFRAGVPVGMLVRDFGGVRVLRGRLRARGLDVSLYPGSDVAARDADDLRAKVFYPLLLNHLGELVAGLSRILDADEARYWGAAAGVCREVYAGLRRDPATRRTAREDGRALFAPRLPFKALATMRLLGRVTDYAYAEVPNPLAAAEERR